MTYAPGTWKCSNSAGDGRQHDGRFNPDQASRLQELVHNPALEKMTNGNWAGAT